jgi:flagellar basal body rod protein FlgF
MLEMAPGGWVRVRHADGATGYVRASQVWGE